jgi:type I restriction enzyme M protein
VLFIDARGFGHLVDRTERTLTDDEVIRTGEIYHAWRESSSSDAKGVGYQDIPGLCKSVSLDDIAAAGYLLTPGRYVGARAAEDDGEPADQKIARLSHDLLSALDESARLDTVVRQQVQRLC